MAGISLCMIVKNEEKVLRRCLESAKRLADEIVIVDTGSEDRTREIARQYTSRVYEIPWRDDFSQARNFSFSKADREYCMWLDADDVISEENLERMLEYKERMDGTEDVVMVKYAVGFGEDGRPSLTYCRERILKNREDLRWSGRVHEAVTPAGKVVYWDAAVFHRKEGRGEPGRNLRIYERMRAEGEEFGPRDLFYYGRELMYAGQIEAGARVLREFLGREDGWEENKIQACGDLAACLGKLGREEESLRALLLSFQWGRPRAEICCGIGEYFLRRRDWRTAAYWYEEALAAGREENLWGFVREEYRDYIPHMQLCVCLDRLGEREKAYGHHLLAKSLRPEAAEVRYNEEYFRKVLGNREEG